MTELPEQSPDTGLKLNVGCGRNILPGWVNIDAQKLEGVDCVVDLDRCIDNPLPFENDSVDEFLLSHVLEHLHEPLALMQELHRVAKPGAKMTIRVPYGSSDDAYEDPTHVRPYFIGSFAYFSQPVYWRADYGYRGDWQPEVVTVTVPTADNQGLSVDEVYKKIMHNRNVVTEMVVQLTAIKPVRAPQAGLYTPPHLSIQLI